MRRLVGLTPSGERKSFRQVFTNMHCYLIFFNCRQHITFGVIEAKKIKIEGNSLNEKANKLKKLLTPT